MSEAVFAAFMQDLPSWNGESTEIETVDFLLALITYTRPKLIAEAGTWMGHFAVPAARVAALWGGEVHTWDPVDYGWTAQVEIPPNLHYHQADYDLGTLQPDFAFIDSGRPRKPDDLDHYDDEDGVEHGIRIRHIAHTLQHHQPNTIIAVHDTKDADWTGCDLVLKAAFSFRTGRGLSLVTA